MIFKPNLTLGIRQIAGSDVILLNKVDLVSPEDLQTTETLIHHVNPAASVYRTIRGDVDLGLIMGIAAYASAPKFQPTTPSSAHTHTHDDCDDAEHHHDHPPEPTTHYELRGISSLQVSCPVLDVSTQDRLDEWIRTVLWESRLPGAQPDSGPHVLRCKGLWTLESGEQFILQGVRSMYEISKVEGEEVMGVPTMGKIVLIGKGLNDDVRRSLENVINRRS